MNPFTISPRNRLAGFLAVAVVLVTCCAISTPAIGASAQTSRSTALPTQPPSALRDSPDPIVRLAAQAVYGTTARRRGYSSFVTGMTVSGSTAYTSTVQVWGNNIKHLKIVGRVVAQDVITGARRELIQRRSSGFIGLVAGQGHLYSLLYRTQSIRKQKGHVQLVDLGDPSGKPVVLTDQNLSVRNAECVPARLTGINAQAEALVVRPLNLATCEEEIGSGKVEAVSAGGGRRVLVSPVSVTGPVVNRGDFLLYERNGRLRGLNLTTGQTAQYWRGEFGQLDLDANGNVLLTNSGSYFDDYWGGSERSTPVPFLNIPFLNPAAMQVADRVPTKRIPYGVFCGSGYVELIAAVRNYDDYYYYGGGNDGDESSFYNTFVLRFFASNGAFNGYFAGPLGIELRTTAGVLVRSLGVIDEGETFQPICEGNTLTVPVKLPETGKFEYRRFDAS